jgi:hypothetical protein
MELNPTGKLAEALAKAQAEMSNPKFDKTNPHFRNKFASLAAVRDAVIPVLARNGIACIQNVYTAESGRVACTTSLYHGSGETLTFGPLEMPVSKSDAQGFGSAATYARRYHLMAVANVVGDEDDDANEATGKPGQAENVGQWDHSPKDGLGPTNTRQVNADAKRLIAAQDDQDKLWSIWAEIKDDHAHATAVWGAIPRSIKDRINDAKAVKEPRAA